jgi:chromosome condensin MukBEF MukE localization factor
VRSAIFGAAVRLDFDDPRDAQHRIVVADEAGAEEIPCGLW